MYMTEIQKVSSNSSQLNNDCFTYVLPTQNKKRCNLLNYNVLIECFL